MNFDTRTFEEPEDTAAIERKAIKHSLAPHGSEGRRKVGDWRKRLLDIALAGTALLLLMPLMLMIAAIIRMTSSGPVIYGHQRVGMDGRQFKCLKFRTMVPDGDRVLRNHLLASEAARREWDATRKLKRDPRVTSLGEVLRSTSADELPQLLNILRGEMSVVGPRPVVESELLHYGEYAKDYCSARPGLTGLWQVSGRNDVTYEARVRFDHQYCKSWSLRRDLLLIAKTVPAVLARRGVY